MTSNLKKLCFLFFLTGVYYAYSENSFATESDAEEKEEEILSIMHENETSLSNRSPDNHSFSRPLLDDLLDSKRENVWWENDTTDYDELHDDKKSDSSLENSVDRDLLENVNYFLPDTPTPDSSTIIDFKRELSSDFFLMNNETSSTQVWKSSSQTICGFGARKCTPVDSSSILVADESELIQPTSSPFPLSSLETVSEELSYLDDTSSVVVSDIAASVSFVLNYATPTFTESTTIQTSDNLILIEGTEVNKDESVMQGQLGKGDKSRQIVKHGDNLSDMGDENLARTFFKTTEITPDMMLPVKESISEITVIPTSAFLTKLFSSTSTVVEDSLQVKPISYISAKSNIPIYESISPVKEIFSDIDHKMKTPLDFYTRNPSTFSTVSWTDFKFSVPVENEENKKYGEKIVETTPILFSSFMPVFSPSESSTNTRMESSSIPKVSMEQDSSSTVILKSSFVTPVYKSEITSTPVDAESKLPEIIKDDKAVNAVPPPRLTNPGCSSLPVCVEITLLETTWQQFCGQKQEFQQFLAKSVSHYTRPIHPYHIVLDAEACSVPGTPQLSPDVSVSFYVTNDSGEYEERMTEVCGMILRKWAPSTFKTSVIEVRFYNSEGLPTHLPIIPELNTGFVAAVSISAVAGVALCLLCILLIVMKQKLTQGRSSDTTTPTADAYSLDSLSISASFRRRRIRRSARSYLNHAFNDQEIPSHPLSEKTLTSCMKIKDLLEEEYKRIPMAMPKLDSIPDGAHVKNRYSNILPKAESRVMLSDPSGDPLKCYINANFVKGYEGKAAFYIACQAPLPEGVEDFWRMIWEQQCRVIVMLTMFEENGTSRCAVYFPQSTLISQQPFGDFQVSLVKKDVYEFYTLSTLRLLDLEKNLFRDIVHLWYTGWPDVGVPKDPSSLVTFVQQCRPFINCNTGPTVVHCSTGTGRTGVFLALDICMREYEESRSIDILQCVSQLRRDRAGAVQNKDQYFLIHEAMLEYVSRMNNQSQRPSVCS